MRGRHRVALATIVAALLAATDPVSYLLSDGRVLVAGGFGDDGFGLLHLFAQRGPNGFVSEPLGSAEIYDPATITFARTGSLTTVRTECTATLLPDGRVLFAGGADAGGSTLRTAELFVPANGTDVRPG